MRSFFNVIIGLDFALIAFASGLAKSNARFAHTK
jgi:hypothetical protein